jgi:MoaA/NifB/PqqE/SkfB family radical SAM enzyme
MDEKIYYYLGQVDKLLNGEFVPPITCEIDPSNNCMLNCNFCMYSNYLRESDAKNVNLDYWVYRRLIRELRELGTLSITFTGGGEPLMHPKINEMILDALIEQFEIGLVTNGVLLDKITNLDKFKFIRISIDSYNAKMYKVVKGKNNFDRVIENTKLALTKNPTVGWSYVINEQNNKDLEKAEQLAEDIGVTYIQFKPAYINGEVFKDYKLPDKKVSIKTERYIAKDKLPCVIASLIGVVGADANVYFCCQMRGQEAFKLGSLYDENFGDIWKRRVNITPDVSSCPMCRYMNYAKAYKEIVERGTLFFQHKNFL